MKQCSTCSHFVRLGEEIRGYCYATPPVVFATGNQHRPMVKAIDHACGLHRDLMQGEQPQVRVKVNPDTPGLAAKSARKI